MVRLLDENEITATPYTLRHREAKAVTILLYIFPMR
jgi:hypothetical protein